MDSLKPFIALVFLVVVLVAVAFLLRKLRLTELGRIKISNDDAEKLSASLMEYVKTKAYKIDTKVNLTPFWKKNRMSEADKAFVLAPHFDSELLLVEKVTEPWTAVLAERLTDWVFIPVDRSVYLNPQERTRMLSGKPINHVHGNQYNDQRTFDQSIRDNTGPVIIGSIYSGDDGSVTSSSSAHVSGLTSHDMQRLVDALRLDAGRLQAIQARPVEELATEVQQAVTQDATGRFNQLVQRATGLAGLANGALAATQSVIDLIRPGT